MYIYYVLMCSDSTGYVSHVALSSTALWLLD